MDAHVGRTGPAGRTVFSSVRCPSLRSTAKALTVPSLLSPTRSVSLAEYSRVPAALKPGSSDWFPSHRIPAGVNAPFAIDPEEMDAASIARRQIHLGRQHVAQRRTESADIGHRAAHGLAPIVHGANRRRVVKHPPVRLRFSETKRQGKAVVASRLHYLAWIIDQFIRGLNCQGSHQTGVQSFNRKPQARVLHAHLSPARAHLRLAVKRRPSKRRPDNSGGPLDRRQRER